MPTILSDLITISHANGGCVLNDPALTDWPGAIRMGVDDLQGWRKTADLNVIRVARGVGDGDYLASRFPSKARMLMMEGYIIAATRAEVDSLFDSLVSEAFPLNTDITLTRGEPVPKFVTCRLAGPIEDTQYIPAGMRWSAVLLCANPFKYDAVGTISGGAGVSGLSLGGMVLPLVLPLEFDLTANGEGNQATVVNLGTADTYPVITVNGPLLSGWRVENATTIKHMSFSVDLGATDSIVIDTSNKTALLNGAPVTGLINGEWWPLIPKINIIRLYGNYDPAASFTISAKSAWR